MIDLRKEIEQFKPSVWQEDEHSAMTGRLRYYAQSGAVSDEDLDAFLIELSSRGALVSVERRNPWIYIDVVRRFPLKKQSPLRLHLLLFTLAFITMAMTGAEFLGHWVFDDWKNIFLGFPYAISLLGILTIHEMGHYTYARRYKLPVTLPYFIPFYLPFIFHLGTFGAFIRMQGQMINRRTLLDVGLYGPVWGFFASLIVLTLGFALFPDYNGMVQHIQNIHPFPMPEGEGVNIFLGENLLFIIYKWVFNVQFMPMNEFYHFPLIFAGWVGTVVTALNLLPVGQLDGGHLIYGLLKEKAKYVGMAFIAILLVLSFFTSGWTFWVLLLIFLVRVKHPQTMDDDRPLDQNRRYLAYFALAIFVLCFVPMPISIG